MIALDAIPTRFAPRGGTSRTLALQAAAELRRHLRAPDFAFAAMALPLLFYFMFAAPRASEQVAGGTIGGYCVAVFGIYGILSIALSGIGSTIVEERGRGDLRLIRVTPLPGSAYMGAKLLFVFLASVVVVMLLGVAGRLTGAGLSFDRFAMTAAVLVLGALALAPIGFITGFLVRPGSAIAVNLLILMPLSLVGGVFMGVDQLPSAVQQIAQVTPTYHLYQIVLTTAGFQTNAQLAIDFGWLVGWAAASGTTAALVYRRFVARQFA
jgi:ABC-2 type transport system permease protein